MSLPVEVLQKIFGHITVPKDRKLAAAAVDSERRLTRSIRVAVSGSMQGLVQIRSQSAL